MKAAYKSFMPVFDKNLNCMFDKDEFLLTMQAFNFNNSIVAELKYFRSFNGSDSVPLTSMIDSWIDFQTAPTGDERDVELLKQAFQHFQHPTHDAI